jgi:hypothetical protein
MHGVKSMRRPVHELDKVFHIVAEKTAASCEPLSGVALGCALHGLKQMDGTSTAVRRLLAVLAEKLQSTHEASAMNARSVANAIFGLNNMGSQTKEVVDVLAALLPRARLLCDDASVNPYNALEITSALFGKYCT